MNNIAPHLTFPAEKMLSIRDGYGDGVVDAGRKNRNVVVLCADLAESTRSHWFKQEFPERFFEVGVAEQNLVTIASGMATAGKIPFVASYAIFSPGRNWEQIRTTVCYNNAPIKIIGSHAGLTVGPDGATHQALEDIALMRVLPNMTVLTPCDYIEARKVVLAAVSHPHPVYIRLNRAPSPVFTTIDSPFEIGQAEIMRTGNDISIIACGSLVYDALIAANQLAQQHRISAEVINVSTIKPIDEDTVLESCRRTRHAVTVEDHQIAGGLGGAIAELLSEHLPIPIKRVGVKDRFGQSGSPIQLATEYGLTSEDITLVAKETFSTAH